MADLSRTRPPARRHYYAERNHSWRGYVQITSECAEPPQRQSYDSTTYCRSEGHTNLTKMGTFAEKRLGRPEQLSCAQSRVGHFTGRSGQTVYLDRLFNWQYSHLTGL